MDIHRMHENIQDSVARQKDWGTDNFIGGPDGTDLRDMTEDELGLYFAEQMGQGITRQGGNS